MDQMRHLVVVALFATTAPASLAAPPAPKLDSAELAHKLEDALSGGKPKKSSAEIRKELEALKSQAGPREQPLIDRMIRLLAEVDTLSAPDLVSRSAQLTRDLAALAPDDFTTQRNAAALLDHLWIMSSGLDGVPDLTAEARRTATALTQKFPSQASAWGRLAFHLINEEGATEAALRTLHRCARLDPKVKWCPDTFAATAKQFTQPRCAATDLKEGFALYRGNAQAASAETPRAVTVAGKNFWTLPQPALSAADVRSLEVAVGGGVLVSLANRKKLEPFRASVAWKDAWSLLTVGSSTVAAASHASPVPQGLLLDTTVDLAQLCNKVERRQLPKDL
jgi:hypothetical protein